MAGMESIDVAGEALDGSVYELLSMLRAMREMAEAIGERTGVGSATWPAWFSVMEGRAAAIEASCHAYRMAVHQHARPVLGPCPCHRPLPGA